MIISPYERRYRDAILNLIFYSRRQHSHLDWYKPGNWLDTPASLLRLQFEGPDLLGFMGVSMPLNRASWLRLLAVADHQDALEVLMPLWADVESALREAGADQIAALLMNRWLETYLPDMGFHHAEEVITLHRGLNQLPDKPGADMPDVTVRLAYQEDLAEILRIDHAAFATPWQMNPDEQRQALRQSACATLASYEGELIGYQISTRHYGSGHLARLAVLPEYQGRGVGARLLEDLIERFNRRAVRTITVNTQQSNTASQRLYHRYGFRRNGFDIPVWVKTF